MSEVYIPGDTEWYVGEPVEEFKAADEPENLVHINMTLIRADSPEVAYEKAMALGESANRVFTNTEGVEVSVRFRGYVVSIPSTTASKVALRCCTKSAKG